MENNTVKSVEVKLLRGKNEEIQVKAFKRRWIILFMYMYYACFPGIQWIEYSSITNIVVKYYNVSTLAVDWTSIVYMATFPLLIIPASLVMETQGLRTTGLIGCLLTFIGTSVKVLSIRPDFFWIVLLGQTILSIAQTFISALPPKIASVWFKSSEISTACAFGVFGGISGNAIGYILPSIVVEDSDDMDDIASGLKLLCWILTVLMIPVTIAVICYFPEQPSLPPSTTEASRRMNQKKFDKTDFFRSIKYLFQNKGFLIHMVAYSINVAVSSAAMTLLNQFVLQNFEGAAEHAGRMGFLMIILGMVGIILFGVLMDKTRKYKEIALISYLLFGISFVFLMFSLEYRSLIATYISCGFVGFFFSGYLPVGFELGVELTFPAQEVTTSGIIVASSQLVGVVVTVGAGYLNLWLGPMWTMAVQAVFVFLGTLITVFIPNKMLRQQAIEGRVVNTERKISHSSK